MKPVNQPAELLPCGPSRDAEAPFKNELPGQQTTEHPATLGSVSPFWRSQRLLQFIKFCMVGGSGVFVDMGILYLLADRRLVGLDITFSKICAAEIAMINNFLWNEFWTFRFRSIPSEPTRAIISRFVRFNMLCGVGVIFAVFLLHLFHLVFRCNLYLSNLFSIALVTIWNFGTNVRFNWPIRIPRYAKTR